MKPIVLSVLIVFWLILAARLLARSAVWLGSSPQKTFKEQLNPAVLLPADAPVQAHALIVKLYCRDPQAPGWQPCEDAKNLNPDKNGNITILFKGVLDDGTEFRIAPIGK